MPGLAVSPVHGSWEYFDQKRTIEMVERHPGELVGVKVLASYLHCGPMEITSVNWRCKQRGSRGRA